MRVASLELKDFRSYERLNITLGPGLTVIVGANGEGKTNLLEAIMLSSRLRSPRTDQVRDSIRWGADLAEIHTAFIQEERSRHLNATIGPRGLTVKVDGNVPKRRVDALGELAAVQFTPDDLRLVKDEPEKRRVFLDSVLGLSRRRAARLPSEYSRTVRQRNALLKRIREGRAGFAELQAWDEQLVGLGTELSLARRDVCADLRSHAFEHHHRLSGGERLGVEYRSKVLEEGATKAQATQRFLEVLASRRDEEVARGVTAVGPHRDDVHLTVDGRSARDFGSQGQQRSVALALKLAELDVIADAAADRPVMLLDDVMSELDATRRGALADTLSELEQTIVTTTTPEYLSATTDIDVRWLSLKDGRVTEGLA